MRNARVKILTVLLAALTAAPSSYALDILGRDRTNGGKGTRRGLVALYRFNPTFGATTAPANRILDESGVGTPLDLEITDTAQAFRVCEPGKVRDPIDGQFKQLCYLKIQGDTALVRSVAAADKITNQCRTNQEITVEAWVRNFRNEDLRTEGRLLPLKIVTLGSNVRGTTNSRYDGSSNNFNFSLGTTYDGDAGVARYIGSYRRGNRTVRAGDDGDGFNAAAGRPGNAYNFETSQAELTTNDERTAQIMAKNRYQQLVYTVNRTGDSRLYASGVSRLEGSGEDPFELAPMLRAEDLGVGATNPLSGWTSGFYLSLGNELTARDTMAPAYSTAFTTENRRWPGEIYLLAIYCNAHTEEEVLGNLAPGANYQFIPPNPAVTVTAQHEMAAQLYTRLVGVRVPVTAPIISGVNDPRIPEQNVTKGMVQWIQEGQPLQAALIATQQDGFYNITVRDFAKRMSTRDETVNTPLNDFVATVIGVARDDRNAQELLTGNYFYKADPSRAAVPSDMVTDILRSNTHYESLENLDYNLRQVLEATPTRQKIFTGTTVQDHPDPAGLITSRAFMAAHAIAGTNRRLVEYTFREFACIPIAGWSDTSGPDNRVGMDVDRFPGGDHNKFLTNCRGCHSNMDGMRGAFAKYNFADGFVKYAPLMPATPMGQMEGPTNMQQNPLGIAFKMNRNDDTFPDGWRVVDDSWINNANRGANATYFGWPDTGGTGNGVRTLGALLAQSKAFPDCMTKRAFRSLCKREPAAIDSSFISTVSTEFVNSGYNLERLFARLAISQECTGFRINP